MPNRPTSMFAVPRLDARRVQNKWNFKGSTRLQRHSTTFPRGFPVWIAVSPRTKVSPKRSSALLKETTDKYIHTYTHIFVYDCLWLRIHTHMWQSFWLFPQADSTLATFKSNCFESRVAKGSVLEPTWSIQPRDLFQHQAFHLFHLPFHGDDMRWRRHRRLLRCVLGSLWQRARESVSHSNAAAAFWICFFENNSIYWVCICIKVI